MVVFLVSALQIIYTNSNRKKRLTSLHIAVLLLSCCRSDSALQIYQFGSRLYYAVRCSRCTLLPFLLSATNEYIQQKGLKLQLFKITTTRSDFRILILKLLTMKKMIFTMLCIIAMTSFLRAQVGINITNPDASAALDIVSPDNDKGVLIPRMTTIQKTSIANPSAGLMVYDTSKKCLSQNVGTSASPIWICLAQNETRFFYMPSVAINASAVTAGLTLDLYAEYATQFGSPDAKSSSAPASIPYFPLAGDLYYYITYYDPTIIKVNGVSDSGVMSYDILRQADYQSFMNVVFVVK